MSKSGSDSTAISPPAGTGMQSGMGEAFSLDLNSGQGNFTVPFEVPEGVAGFKPTLKLEYTHGNGNGAFGLGWRLPLRQIERRLDFGTPGDGAQERFLDGSVELCRTNSGEMRPLRETTFSRYRKVGEHWEITEKDGKLAFFGLTAEARVADPDQPSRVQTWLLEREEDVNGNRINYEYDTLDGNPYLVAVRYARFVVRLSYEPRPDLLVNGRAGFVRRVTRRCRSIALHLASNNQAVRSLAFTYTQAPLSNVSLMSGLQLTAHGAGQPDVVKNPLSFQYSGFDAAHLNIRWVDAQPGTPAPPPLSDPETALLALDDLPVPGILANRNGRHIYWPNDGAGGWGFPRVYRNTPFASSFAAQGIQFIDMDATGSADMLVGVGSNPLNGYYENGGSAGFTTFRPYPTQARVLPPFESGRVRVIDIEGDGVVDAMFTAGRGLVSFRNHGRAGWSEPTITANRPEVSFDDPLVFLADMTGDGMPDIVRVRSGQVEYWVNLGHGRFGERAVMQESPRLEGIQRTPEQILLMDVDGDGCSDLVRISTTGIQLYINRHGHSFAPPQSYPIIPIANPNTVRAVDLDGRAARGLLYNSRRAGKEGYVYVNWDQDSPAYLLQRIDNGVGLQSEIQYAPLVEMARLDRSEGRLWDTFMPFALWVVSATREQDSTNNRLKETRYRYHDGHFDPLFRRFQGFRQVDRREVGDDSRADILTRFTFLMDQASVPGNSREHAHLDRMLSRVEVLSLDGSSQADKPYRIEETEYDFHELETLPDGNKRVFIFAHVTRKRYRERTADERVEEMIYSYDSFGNITREVKRGFGSEGGVAATSKMLISEFSYASDVSQTLFKPSRIVKRDGANLLRELRRYYDGLPLGQLTRGLQTREEILVLPEAAYDLHYAGMDSAALGYFRQNDVDGNPAVFAMLRECTYTPQGNRATERTRADRLNEIFYDDDNLHVVREVVNGRQNDYVREPVYGKPLELRAHNGEVVRLTYDAFGRAVTYQIADDTPANPTRRITYDDGVVPNAMHASYRISPDERLETVTYFDGTNKEIQKRVERQPGEVIVSGWLDKNPWSQTRREFEPTLSDTLNFARPDTTGKSSRQSFYDGEGRPVRTIDYNGGVSSANYGPFEIAISDALDNDPANPLPPQPRRERVNVWNQRTEVIEPGAVSTRFQVSLLGELQSLSDSAGTIATYTYDLRGNRLTLNHRDAGQRRQWFDNRDDIARTVDEEANDASVTRDAEGRLASLNHNGVQVELYTYADSTPGADGRLTRAAYNNGQQDFTYDLRGRLTRHEYIINGQPFALVYEYNDMGKPIALFYPDGTRITRSYYRNGMTKSIAGIIDEVLYDARNLPTRIRFSNGLTTEIVYEAGVGWVASQRTTDRHGVLLENVTLSYDLLHRLIAADDTAPGAEHSAAYGYDVRDQLQQVNGNDAGGTYTHQYSYSHGSNLTNLGESNWQLQYSDGARPDRMNGIARAGEPLFDVPYNANGNITALPGRSFVYNFKNQLTQITLDDGAVVHYEYDFRGQRTRRTATRAGATTETLFVGDLVEVRDGTSANFIIFNQMRVALLHAGHTRWLHVDRLGSTQFFSNEAGEKIAHIAYHPFGNVRQRSGTADYQGFAAHPVDDDIGLVFMGRRWYSMQSGRFLTPDPLYLYQPERANGAVQQLRLYTYVGNDPLNKVDPTGLSFWSVVGAVVGVIVGIVVAVAVVAAFASGIGFGILAVVGVIGLLTISYVAASATQGSGFGEFMRGFMIGFNAGMNATLLTFMGLGALGVVIGVINFLAAFDTVANSEVYQGILGWSSWLMPMSWLATGIGLVFFVINGLAAIFTLNMVDSVRIESLSIDWGTGTIITEGGLLFLPGFSGGYNLGNFSYITPGSSVADHESGHTLNVAAFGSIFHFIGAIDENVVQGNPADAYAERLAESNDPSTSDPNIIPIWV